MKTRLMRGNVTAVHSGRFYSSSAAPLNPFLHSSLIYNLQPTTFDRKILSMNQPFIQNEASWWLMRTLTWFNWLNRREYYSPSDPDHVRSNGKKKNIKKKQ